VLTEEARNTFRCSFKGSVAPEYIVLLIGMIEVGLDDLLVVEETLIPAFIL
jgi:hypothetical protein